MGTSQELIGRLLERGLTKAEIGRRLGRDSSLIGQVYAGKKPGSNLADSLQDLLDGKPVREPERRTDNAGKPRPVRKSKKPVTQKRLLKDRQGRIKWAAESKLQHVLRDRLERVAKDGGKVSFQVTYFDTSGELQRGVKLYGRGGIYAQRAIYEMLNFPAGSFAWVKERLNEQLGNSSGNGSFPSVDKVVSVGLIAVYEEGHL